MQRSSTHGIRLVGVCIPLQEPMNHIVIHIRTCKVEGCHTKRVQGLINWKVCIHDRVNVPDVTVHYSIPQKLFGLIELIHYCVATVLCHIFRIISVRSR